MYNGKLVFYESADLFKNSLLNFPILIVDLINRDAKKGALTLSCGLLCKDEQFEKMPVIVTTLFY